ncbi:MULTISPECIES: hypothetical protein [Apibacter]|nr:MULTISPECIES: hypothetical protein [Apibacter]
MKNSKLKSALVTMNSKKNSSVKELTVEEIKVIKGGSSERVICLYNCGVN